MKSVVFREKFTSLPANINWFPGHMRKAMRNLDRTFKKTDIFIEVRDARLPRSSENPELLALLPPGMKRLVIYNKVDLVPEKLALAEIRKLHEETKVPFFHLSTKQNLNINKLLTFIQTKANPQFKTVGAWLMIGGVPNVGKSTIINSLRTKDKEIAHTKKSGARTGGVPCVTKSVTGFKIRSDPPTYVHDTPGIIIPKIEDPLVGMKLSLCNCIRDGIIEPESVCDYALYVLNKHRQFSYVKRYNLPNALPTDSIHDLLYAIQQRMGLQEKTTAYERFLTDFREGRLGKVFLDQPL